ncbi:MAG: ribonuclease HII [Veillonella sp.]|uniref:ribonuclease HII n=1 Tax=Veillonella sp. TaxID=1926307 RepID=UPI0025D388D7|nr:ribonuclease HII [Veillonella sp.]MBS4912872.1 ribonuclease HII [Veillonella sp.]
MTQEEFRKLKVGQIKELLDGSVEFDYLLWAQEDSRSSVRKLAQAYVMRQKKVLLEKQRIDNLYTYENSFYEEGLYHVAGVDEVGRGPIAGPVTVAAVILPPNLFLSGLNDSKKLSPQKRDSLYDQIMAEAVAVSCISYGPEIIDKLNIYQATRQAMYEAISTLKVQAEAVLVDAMPLPDLTVPVESLIKGDSKSASIAAASIIAKVTRDRYMESLEDEYPGYGFAVHKGYFTPLHREALENQGVTPLHRKSFEPIKTMVGFK